MWPKFKELSEDPHYTIIRAPEGRYSFVVMRCNRHGYEIQGVAFNIERSKSHGCVRCEHELRVKAGAKNGAKGGGATHKSYGSASTGKFTCPYK